jgi:hypothetical protein
MRTVRRLRLRCFTFYEYLSRAVHSVTLDPVEASAGPSKVHLFRYLTSRKIHEAPEH